MLSRAVVGGLFAAGAGLLAYLLAKGKPDATVEDTKPAVVESAEPDTAPVEVPTIDQPESITTAADTGGDH